MGSSQKTSSGVSRRSNHKVHKQRMGGLFTSDPMWLDGRELPWRMCVFAMDFVGSIHRTNLVERRTGYPHWLCGGMNDATVTAKV